LLYPVSLEILHQIFQRFGKVLKIVTFTKNNSFQALIQYPDAQTAQHAKQTLDGQNIYNGCCTLRIDNSKLTALNVKYNNDKSRDFTNPTLPAGEPGSDLIASAGGLVNASDLLLLAAGKNQAFLEMADEISATAMVSVFNTTPPTVRGRTVYVQFSNHRELKTDQNHSITVRRTLKKKLETL